MRENTSIAPLTAEQRAELRRLYEAATTGPLGVRQIEGCIVITREARNGSRTVLADVDGLDDPVADLANASLWTAMHEALPGLLDTLERLTAELEVLRAPRRSTIKAKCQECASEFFCVINKPHQKFCSKRCQAREWARRYYHANKSKAARQEKEIEQK